MTAREPGLGEAAERTQSPISVHRLLGFNRDARSAGLTVKATLACAAVLLVSFVVAPGIEGALGGALGLLMLGVNSADARRFVVPDLLSGGAFALGVIRAAAVDDDSGLDNLLMALCSAAFAAGLFLLVRVVYRRFRGRDGLGLGDVKLAGVAAVWLSWPMLSVVIELAAIAALVVYVARQHKRKRLLRGSGRVPFGAFLALAIWIGWATDMFLQTA